MARRGALSEHDRNALLALPLTLKSYDANVVILREKAIASHCAVVVSGMVSRIKELESGNKQIVALYIAGDAVDLQSIMFVRVDHALYAHSSTTIAWIAYKDFLSLAATCPAVANGLWLDTLIDASIFRQWTANLGQRNARERIAHFMLEIATRLDTIGLYGNDSFELPLTQTAMAEALGLSLVHMNKTLQSLKNSGLIAVLGRTVTMLSRSDLIELAEFDATYLYLDQTLIKKWDYLGTLAM